MMNRRGFLHSSAATTGVGHSIAELFKSITAAQNSSSTVIEASSIVHCAEEIEHEIKTVQA